MVMLPQDLELDRFEVQHRDLLIPISSIGRWLCVVLPISTGCHPCRIAINRVVVGNRTRMYIGRTGSTSSQE
jgi:hypothetical protein